MRKLLHRFFVVCIAASTASGLPAQSDRPPVIDVHVHSTNTTPVQELERMRALNIRYIVVSGLGSDLPDWREALASDRYLPSVAGFPCPGGRALFIDRPCWNGSSDELPDVDWLRGEIEAGRVQGLGEIAAEYSGLSPDDPRFEPYWQMAEEFDLPVAIHMGFGPAGAAYPSDRRPVTFPEFRIAAGDPLPLENVLLRHRNLRLIVMHAGWPYLDSMTAILYAHPHVAVDVAALQANIPRAAYYRYLHALIDAGFGDRILFGSDFPNAAEAGIDAILEADFLSDEQKADILCNNARRFLRLDENICAS